MRNYRNQVEIMGAEMEYSLRYAAGAYWLFAVSETSENYRPPLRLNRMGADILRMAGQGLTSGQILQQLGREYEAQDEADFARLEADITAFWKTMADHGIDRVGEKGVRIL